MSTLEFDLLRVLSLKLCSYFLECVSALFRPLFWLLTVQVSRGIRTEA